MFILDLLIFFGACIFMWISSTFVTQGVEHFSKNIKLSSFMTSFLILGVLTSVTEISVGLNAIVDKKPGIFVGNLIGGSFVVLLFIIPLFAILNKGISFEQHFNLKKIIFFLLLLISPSLLILDGEVSRYDALLLIFLYGVFFYIFQKQHNSIPAINVKTSKHKKKDIIFSIAKIVGGGIMIYFASQLLVEKTIYFAELIKVPTFLVSILILSVGTNLPELAIAINSAFNKQEEIALGDYIGSAASNPLLFGIFTLINGPFTLQTNHFDFTLVIILAGYILFFFFFRSKNRLSVLEGVILLLVYIVFLLFQAYDIFQVSTVV